MILFNFDNRKVKIKRYFKVFTVRCEAVFTEQIFVKTRRPTAGILTYGKGGQRRIGGKMPVKTDLDSALHCCKKGGNINCLI